MCLQTPGKCLGLTGPLVLPGTGVYGGGVAPYKL